MENNLAYFKKKSLKLESSRQNMNIVTHKQIT